MKWIYSDRKIKILIETFPYDTLIELYDKYGLELRSVSVNRQELNEDIEDVRNILIRKQDKVARKWFNKTIKDTKWLMFV